MIDLNRNEAKKNFFFFLKENQNVRLKKTEFFNQSDCVDKIKVNEVNEKV